MSNKFLDLSLFITTLLSGFYGGTGFFVAMGGNPAIKLLSDYSFAEYWQNVDKYMAARMPVFGPLLMLSILGTAVLLFINRQTISGWLMLIALLIMIGDLVFTLSTNHPLNKLIQSWDLNDLPDDVELVKRKVVDAFNIRLFLMIALFVFALLSVWLRKKN